MHGLVSPANPLAFSLESLLWKPEAASASTSELPNLATPFTEVIPADAPSGSGSGNKSEENDLVTIDRRTLKRVGTQIINCIDDLYSAHHYYRLLLRAAEALSDEGNVDDLVSLLQLLGEKVELEPILGQLQHTHELFGVILAATGGTET